MQALLGMKNPLATKATPAAPSTGIMSRTIGKIWHYVLTGVCPVLIFIPLFSYIFPSDSSALAIINSILVTTFGMVYTFGINGVNLVASNSSYWAVGKFMFNQICITLSQILSIEYAGRWWLPLIQSILQYANPWYIFDIIRVYDPEFQIKGYKIPFLNKLANDNISNNRILVPGDIGYIEKELGKETRTYGLFYKAVGGILVFFLPGIYAVVDSLPAELKGKFQPFLDLFSSILGGVSALAGGGLGIMLLPKLVSSVQGNITKLMRGGSEEHIVQSGIEQTGGSGENVPTVEEIAQSLLKNKSTAQGGGGASTDPESATFMGLLGITVLGGISLALVRRKRVSAATL
jgi:hypothetical protein